jgi:4-amino-4-deoxy-L-arabinose transferase-like glycosyltransferase
LTVPVLLGLGFLLRLFHAEHRFLNADEALHYFLSVQPSIAATYRATLTTAHPPLLIVFLHYWGMLGGSEWFLRLPSVLAGTAFCWVMYRWLKMVADSMTALFALVLLLFSPALVLLSAEVRQYALLLLFSSLGLYSLDAAIERNSAKPMLASAFSLALALVTHYSSLIVAFALGIYALLRLKSKKPGTAVLITWIAGQVSALGLVAFLVLHHVSKLKAHGVPQGIANSYLRRSVFQPGHDQILAFVLRSNIRLFHYFFSQAAVGVLALALFAAGIFSLLRKPRRATGGRPAGWQLALLLVLPLAVNCALAIFRVYPYGGSRHNSYLSLFVFPAIAVALEEWEPERQWRKLAGVGLLLAATNVFPSPLGEYIHFSDQSRSQMAGAVRALDQLPPGSVIFTDDQGGLLLSYYLCHAKVVQIEQDPFQPFWNTACRRFSVVSIDPDDWIFKAETFTQQFEDAQRTYQWRSGDAVWFFQAGWLVDKEFALRRRLEQFGCSAPQDFGSNILLCRLTTDSTTAKAKPN